ncbi:hypothetical protein YC2023_095546 [Brassica napus]
MVAEAVEEVSMLVVRVNVMTTTTYVLMHLYPSYISIDTYPQPTQPPLTQSYKPFGLD